MKEELLKYLEQFTIQTLIANWNDLALKQARAIFTTLCFVGNINADTKECDDILYTLYSKAAISELDIKYEEFENFMLELIV